VSNSAALNRILLLVLLDVDRPEGSSCITLEGGPTRRCFHVSQGAIVATESNVDAERLGDMLTMEGTLDAALLEPIAEEAQRNNVLLGSQMVKDGLLSDTDLSSALERQIAFRLGRALASRGVVTVEPYRPVKSEAVIALPVSLMAAFRAHIPVEAIDNSILKNPEPWPLRAEDLSTLELGPAETRLAKKLTGGIELDTILNGGNVPTELVMRLAGALRALGVWKMSTGGAAMRGARVFGERNTTRIAAGIYLDQQQGPP
jgi:hypothetical protein